MEDLAKPEAEEEVEGRRGGGKQRGQREDRAETARQISKETRKESGMKARKEAEEKVGEGAEEKAGKEAEETPVDTCRFSNEDSLGLLLREYRLEPARTRQLLAHFGVNEVEVCSVATRPTTSPFA